MTDSGTLPRNHALHRVLCGIIFLCIPLSCMAQAVAPSLIDPVKNMCSRWQHQTTVKDGTLYIDGGAQTFNLTKGGNRTNDLLGVNEYIIEVSLKETWNWWTNVTETAYNKSTNPTTGITPFTGVVRGTAWSGPASDSRIYTFGGTSYRGNTSFTGWSTIPSVQNPLWSYDTKTREWDTFKSDIETVPSYGSSAEAPDLGLGFYLNGQVDGGTSYSTSDYIPDKTFPLEGMVVVNLTDQTMKNITTPGLPDNYPRVGGSMVYLPNVGKNGLLVSLAGMHRKKQGVAENFTTDEEMVSVDTVEIFDISSYTDDPSSNGTWYSQATSGTIPSPRVDTCAIAVSAPDNSSHNIFVYGGRNPLNGTIYDDIYALSLPSFEWISVYGPGSSPRWGHTCHAVANNRQMITIGGQANTTAKDCDWEYSGVAIFDLTTALWGAFFLPNSSAYTVTHAISDVIGGSETGGATMTSPSAGYASTAVAALMSATRTPLSAPVAEKKSSKLSSGAIAGATIGSVAGASLLAGIFLLLLRRSKARRNKTLPSSSETENRAELGGLENEKQELNAEDRAAEIAEDGQRHELNTEERVVEIGGDRGKEELFLAELPGDEGHRAEKEKHEYEDVEAHDERRREKILPRYVEVRPGEDGLVPVDTEKKDDDERGEATK